MKISLVVAMAANQVIGKKNALPWHLPADLRHFKHLTMGKPLLMGRKTYESIGRPLPGRINIVMTRNPGFTAPGCVVVHSLESGFEAAAGHDEVMVIGGAEFYRQLLPQAERIYLTLIHHDFDGDTLFPELSEADWRELERTDYVGDEKDPWDYSFIVLERVGRD